MVDTMKITTPAMSATDPIRSIGRSSSAGVLATIVRQLHKLPYYGCEAKCLTLNYAIVFVSTQFNPATGERKGLMIADFHTNSTGILAPLNGMVAAGIDHFQPNVRDSSITL